MTRNGKIARLPREVREELNRRLQNGEVGKSLVDWLNSRPEVQSVMASEFGGQPINEPNLTQWKGGGYEDWLAEQESLSETRLLMEEAGQFEKLDGEALTQRLSLWLTVRCAVEARKQRASGADPDLGAFGRLCRGLASLRRGEQAERRLKIEEARLKLEEKRLELSRGEGSETLEKMFWEWTERPDIKKKLRPRPPTFKQRMRAIRRVYGLPLDDEPPKERKQRGQHEEGAAEIERRMAELDREKAELERRKAEEVQSPKSEVQSREGSEDEVQDLKPEDRPSTPGSFRRRPPGYGGQDGAARGPKAEGNPNSEKTENPHPQEFGEASQIEVERCEGGAEQKEDGHEKAQKDTKMEEGDPPSQSCGATGA